MIKDREKSGKINDYKELINFVNNELNLNLTADKPLFSQHSPGPDVNNTTTRSISTDELDAIKNSAITFEKNCKKKLTDKFCKFLKNLRNLHMRVINKLIGKKMQIVHLKNDFFSEYHYWHSSFVILFPNGNNNVYLGEFSYDKAFDYVKNWKKKTK